MNTRTLASGNVAFVDDNGKVVRIVEPTDPATVPDEPVTHENCWKCNGSGVFRGGGRVENGRYIGFEGPCYACKGKGWQTVADEKRNDYYWNHVYRFYP